MKRKRETGLASIEPMEPRVLLSGDIYSLFPGTYNIRTRTTGPAHIAKIDGTTGAVSVSSFISGLSGTSSGIAETSNGELVVSQSAPVINAGYAITSIRRYNLATHKSDLSVSLVSQSSGSINSFLAIDPSNNIYVYYAHTNANTSTLVEVNGATSAVTTVLSNLPNDVGTMAFTPSGELAVAERGAYDSNDGTIVRYNLSTGQADLTIPNSAGYFPMIAISPAGDIYSYLPGTISDSLIEADGATGQLSTAIANLPALGQNMAGLWSSDMAITSSGDLIVATPSTPATPARRVGGNTYPATPASGGITRYDLASGDPIGNQILGSTGQGVAIIAAAPPFASSLTQSSGVSISSVAGTLATAGVVAGQSSARGIVKVTLSNGTGTTVHGPIQITVAASTDTAAHPGADVLLGKFTGPVAIRAGSSVTIPIHVAVPASASGGSYDIVTTVQDAGSSTAVAGGTTLAYTGASIQLSIQQPVIALALSAPASVATVNAQRLVTVDVPLVNNGNITATGALIGQVTITDGNSTTVYTQRLPAIAIAMKPQATRTLALRFMVPAASVASGNYTVSVSFRGRGAIETYDTTLAQLSVAAALTLT